MYTLFSVLLAATLALAAAPNPHQIYALQSSVAAEAAMVRPTDVPTAHDWIGRIQPQPRDRMRRRHFLGGGGHGRRADVPHERALRKVELEQRSLAAGLERERERLAMRVNDTASTAVLVERDVTDAPTALEKRGNGGVWTGVSSYYLFALDDPDRHAVLDAIKGGGFSVVRIFIASVGANNKGSSCRAVNDCKSALRRYLAVKELTGTPPNRSGTESSWRLRRHDPVSHRPAHGGLPATRLEAAYCLVRQICSRLLVDRLVRDAAQHRSAGLVGCSESRERRDFLYR